MFWDQVRINILCYNEASQQHDLHPILTGQVFGELAVLSPGSSSPTTAVTFTNVELYKFESDVLLSLGAKFNSSTVNSLNESLNLYNPPDEKVGHYYRSKYSWETRKKKILKSLVKERPVLNNKFHELDK